MNTIRLACRMCDRDDFDQVAAVPLSWFDVQEVQTYEAALQRVDPNHPAESVSVLDWFTHLGVCPECYAEEIAPALTC